MTQSGTSNVFQHEWPFDQPRNCAVFTVRQIMSGAAPILQVHHDFDDHGWQFLTGESLDMKDAMLVALHEVTSLDDSLYQIADLRPGWFATRESQEKPWRIAEYKGDA